jgi:hypothetical protein
VIVFPSDRVKFVYKMPSAADPELTHRPRVSIASCLSDKYLLPFRRVKGEPARGPLRGYAAPAQNLPSDRYAPLYTPKPQELPEIAARWRATSPQAPPNG